MTETKAAPVRPTQERIARAELYDDGKPTREVTHERPARLGTCWDRYCHLTKSGDAALERHQILAGNQYATDYDKAGYDKTSVGGYEPAVDGGGKGESEYVWAARGRIAKAQRMLRKHEMDLLHAVLFDAKAAKDWARDSGRPARAGLTYLKDALDVLAVHFGFSGRAKR